MNPTGLHTPNIIHAPLDRFESYEMGFDRVEPTHLIQFGKLLGVPISFFFLGSEARRHH